LFFIGLFCRPVAAKKKQFLPFLPFFWTSAFSDVANCHQSQKVEHRRTTTPIQRHQNRFCTPTPSRRNRARNSEVQNRDGQTDKHTDKKLNVLGHPGGG